MSYFCLHLELPSYLAQWLIHWNGDEQPIVFPKYSTENMFLKQDLTKLPYNGKPTMPTATSVAVVIPNFELKKPQYYNYLPVKKRKKFIKIIRSRFILELWGELHRYGYIGKRRDYLFYEFMERHGIEATDTNWNAVAKIYQRQRKYYLAQKRKKN